MTDTPFETKPQAPFTPGPWRVCDFPHLRRIWAISDDIRILASVGSTEADARLMAAAPELYAALRAAEGHLTETLADPTWHPIGHCPTLDLVRAVLRKVER